MNSTLAIIKPDAVRRNLAGQIITRIEHERFSFHNIAVLSPGDWSPTEFYARQHAGKPYYGDLVEFMSSGQVWVIQLSHPVAPAIDTWRRVMGSWNQEQERDLTTIRGQLMQPGCLGMENLVHGSDSLESYEYEVTQIMKVRRR